MSATMPDESTIAKGLEDVTKAEREGSKLFETSVAARGALVSVEVFEQAGKRVVHIVSAGSGRRSAPLAFDRFQARALLAALAGALSVPVDIEFAEVTPRSPNSVVDLFASSSSA